MSRLFALILVASTSAIADERTAMTVTQDQEAILVRQDTESPWLVGEVREGHATVAQGNGSVASEYFFIHLDKPINFSASERQDNFSTDQYHVYDLSFSSLNHQLSGDMEHMVGKKVAIRGKLAASPTGRNPTELNIIVSDIKPGP